MQKRTTNKTDQSINLISPFDLSTDNPYAARHDSGHQKLNLKPYLFTKIDQFKKTHTNCLQTQSQTAFTEAHKIACQPYRSTKNLTVRYGFKTDKMRSKIDILIQNSEKYYSY